MRKRFVLMLCLQSALLVFLFSNVKAQVFNGNLTLSSQADVDAFNYTSVTGILFINNIYSDITNVDHLSTLTSVGTNFLISRQNNLKDLNGLFNLQSINGTFIISDCPRLENIDGLSSLQSVDRLEISGEITGNPKLKSIDSLANLVTCKSLTIHKNDSLKNIDGLSGVTDFWSVSIFENRALTNIDGLSGIHGSLQSIFISSNGALDNVNSLANVTKVWENLIIQFNHALTDLHGLSDLESVDGNLEINFNTDLPNLNGLEKLKSVGGNLEVNSNRDLFDFCGLYNLFHSGTIGGTVEIVRNGANTIDITPPGNITQNADPGDCSAKISEIAIGTAIPVGCLEPFTITHTDFPPGNIFPVGITNIVWYVTDGAGNTASSIQTITVIDNQIPTITCPANITVKCASDVPDVDINSVTAIDNCLAVISHVSDMISNQTCANRFTLTRTYKVTDVGNNTAVCSQVITVYDDIPPQITGFTVSKQSLWPPNHTMRDITLNYTASDNCVNDPIVTITVSSNEPVNGTGDGDTDPDWEIIDDHHVKLRAERAANGDGRIYTITVTVDDGCNPPVSQSKQVMVTHNITGPQSGKPFKVGSVVNFSGVFQDKPGNTHTAKWLLDGSVAANGTVIDPSGNVNGKVSGSYKFNSPGVYKLQMNITDQTGITSYANTNNDLDAIVVIYDPNGGNTYGGGYFNSPAGALRADPAATGKASYGFAMNYFKNSTNPKGETQFEFKVGEFEFNALNFDYFVISNSMAQFKGTGKIIGGQSGVGFTMTVVDGQLDGSGVDKIRMKIYNRSNGTIIYDNQPGANDASLPTQSVGANSIIVISGTNSSLTSANTNQKAEMETKAPEVSNDLDVIAFPNPSSNNFTINVNAKTNEIVTMQVIDIYGRVIETRNVTVNSLMRFGDRYTAGTYFVIVIQGKQHKEIKLIKLSD